MADSARIAGWEHPQTGQWFNIEAGDREPTPTEAAESRQIVISVDVKGEPEPVYWRTSHITEDFDFDEVVDEAERSGHYGEEFV